ncbi:PBSX family phage terminase large subunit [Limosilactobacillus gorillae]|uniref:PBSX family phage terminase large subunit n=1 Tax=Limosilactobacillus gorillae TaxID=1450649 RepID=UPI000A9EEA82|nr:PBSX family phage terminase large subunit [Limosilactobacillus gorillae]
MALSDYFNPKQLEVINDYLTKDFGMMILSGAVRSGKTFVDNWLFVMELRRVSKLAKERGEKHPQVILAGYSSNTIHDNVIASIENQMGLELKPDRHGHYHLYNVDIVPAYTGNSRGMSAIRGMTSYSAYVNEASLSTPEAFQEIINRCSVKGAHIICDTNPDNPQHWLKTDYIENDNPETKLLYYNFTIDDNTRLDPGYVSRLKAATPSGMFYDRMIRGLWVSGDGVVYADFDKDKMLINPDHIPSDLHYYCGVDWGFEHLGSITLWGDDQQGNTYLIKEITAQHKFIDYWVKQAKQIQDQYGKNIIFYVDSARPDNYQEFVSAGIRTVNAKKDRMAGVEAVAELMKQGLFYVNQDGYDQFLDEIYQYIWDEHTGEPIKEHDHVMDSMRYAIFNEHKKRLTTTIKSRFF